MCIILVLFDDRMRISDVPRDGRFPGDPHGRVGWGMITFFALAHMVGATQHHGTGWGGVGDDNVPCTCTHGRCYATSSFLYLHTWSLLRNIMGWGGVGWGMITFLALAHMVGATQHHLSCTCTHGRCYATSWDGVGWGGVGDEVCKERRDSFVLTAGDNCAESLCAVRKNNWDAPIWILQWCETRLSTVIFWVQTS